MMRIGYYAHHHGSGHCRQIDKLAALLPTQKRQQLTVFTSLAPEAYAFTAIDEQQIIRLHPEDERTDDVLKGRAGKYWQPASLHYSPIGNADIQKRSHQILNTIVQRNIDLMIIDVSVEVAMLCRTASIPYLYVRLPGLRDDMPHIDAFAGALALLAPYPQAIEAAMTPSWVCQKTVYLDFINLTKNNTSSHQDFIKTLTTLTADHPNVSPSFATKPIITVVKGYGGHEAIDAKLPELRRLLPSAFIISLGPIDNDMRAYVDIDTHVEDVTPFMHHSDYLLMACGLNAVAQAYYCATPLVVLPDERPHQEQATMAQALIDQGRALSWEQFVHSMSAESTSAYPTKTTSLQTQDTLEDDRSSFSQNADLSKAQALMDSVITYSTAKSWFNEWLLPQLELRPEA
ncbi:hypothetical protein ACTXJ5_00065 [Psychrobacter alimentarius]|uniref:hypothetical protein n=1 Tax=Psychrobacter alimentarius TaxID=261164 RepID=UPI003FCFE6C1